MLLKIAVCSYFLGAYFLSRFVLLPTWFKLRRELDRKNWKEHRWQLTEFIFFSSVVTAVGFQVFASSWS
jgi:NhaP-type Na+/H+ or K+/H+ antiporter